MKVGVLLMFGIFGIVVLVVGNIDFVCKVDFVIDDE